MVKLRNKNNKSIGVATNLEDNVAAEEKDGVPYSQRHWCRQYGDKHHHEPPERHQPHVHVEAFDVVVLVGEVLVVERLVKTLIPPGDAGEGSGDLPPVPVSALPPLHRSLSVDTTVCARRSAESDDPGQ